MKKFAAKVHRAEAKLKNTNVEIKPPKPIGKLGNGWDKIRRDKLSLPVMKA